MALIAIDTGTCMLSPVVWLAIVTLPVYVPAFKPDGLAVTVKDTDVPPATLPLPGVTLSQPPPAFVAAVAVKSRDPPPWFTTFNCELDWSERVVDENVSPRRSSPR
jgi:hypothetical protein